SVLGFKSHSLLKPDDRLIVLAEFAVGDAEVVENAYVVGCGPRQTLKVGDRLLDLSALKHGHDKVEWVNGGRHRHHRDLLVVDYDDGRLALGGVLRCEMRDNGCLESLCSDLPGAGWQQIGIEAYQGDLERER